jgi:hypothetical protein
VFFRNLWTNCATNRLPFLPPHAGSGRSGDGVSNPSVSAALHRSRVGSFIYERQYLSACRQIVMTTAREGSIPTPASNTLLYSFKLALSREFPI